MAWPFADLVAICMGKKFINRLCDPSSFSGQFIQACMLGFTLTVITCLAVAGGFLASIVLNSLPEIVALKNIIFVYPSRRTIMMISIVLLTSSMMLLSSSSLGYPFLLGRHGVENAAPEYQPGWRDDGLAQVVIIYSNQIHR